MRQGYLDVGYHAQRIRHLGTYVIVEESNCCDSCQSCLLALISINMVSDYNKGVLRVVVKCFLARLRPNLAKPRSE